MDVELICAACGKHFYRRKAEINRCKKRGLVNSYCSVKCMKPIEKIPLEKRSHPENLPRLETDDLSPFRCHLKVIKMHCKRNKRLTYDLTLEDLKNQWNKQQGFCPITGWKLKTARDTRPVSQLPKTIDRASVDRIDSSKPYTKDNIQFLSLIAQYAKNEWSETAVIQFCNAVTQFQNGPART